MIHLCYIIWKFKSPRKFTLMGGAENQLLKFINNIGDDSNKHVTIITKQTKGDLKEETIFPNKKIIRIKSTNIPIISMLIFMFLLLFTIIKINRKKRINLIHVPLPAIFISILFLIRYFLKIPIITRVAKDELNPSDKHGLWLVDRLIVRLFMLKLDGIQTLNPISYNMAIKSGYPSMKLFLISNGTIIPLNYRRYDQLTNNIVYIGAMRFFPEKSKYEQKNLLFLIEAFYELHKIKPKLKLIMVGDGNYRSILAKKVKELSLNDAVIFKGYQTNIGKYLLEADIFVNPSHLEGMLNTVVEALASGVFVLCSDIPEHRYLIRNNENGYLFNHRERQDFVEKVIAFYKKPDAFKEIAKTGREFAKQNLSVNKTTKHVLEMYNSVYKMFCETIN
ncbi:MAG: glycosyltransferase [Candidatus Heimdallarchaeota archaeon]